MKYSPNKKHPIQKHKKAEISHIETKNYSILRTVAEPHPSFTTTIHLINRDSLTNEHTSHKMR